MKRLLILLMLSVASLFAFADSTVTSSGPGSVTLKRGSLNIDSTIPLSPTTQAIIDACTTRSLAEQERLYKGTTKTVSTNYFCNVSVGITVKFTPPPVPPKPTDPVLYTQTVACPAPTVGTWTQTRDYVLVSNQWNPTPWLPATAPAGACTVPPTSLLPVMDPAKVPAPLPSFKVPRISSDPAVIGGLPLPNPSDIGAFRVYCTGSHIKTDDPIVFPGQPGKSHPHSFAGNDSTDANSTNDTLLAAGSTCSGGTLDRSAMWVPTMIDTTDGTPIMFSGLLTYYKQGYGGVKAGDMRPVPSGLRMLAGTAAGNPTAKSSAVRYACVGGANGVGWQDSIPTTCFQDNTLIMEVSFPQCWDGVNLDSPDHRSHMGDATGSGCPKAYPVALPAITYEVAYDLSKVDLARMKKWRLSSDNYAADQPAGYSGHGDYIGLWDAATMQKIITNCDNATVDCHTNFVSQTEILY